MISSRFFSYERYCHSYFLGLEVSYSSHGLFLAQCKYIENLIKRTTPMELNLKLKRDDDAPISDPSLYWQLMGNLVYLTITHPYIYLVVQNIRMANLAAPSSRPISRPLYIICYSSSQSICFLASTSSSLSTSSDHSLSQRHMWSWTFFSSNTPLTLQAFYDADYAGCVDTRCTDWCVFLGASPISCKCKKQKRYLNLPPRLSIDLCLMLDDFSLILMSLMLILFLFLEIIQVPSPFPLILSIMSEPNWLPLHSRISSW